MFRAPCHSGGGGWVDEGGPHTCVHACTHAHACTCMRGKHDNFMQMANPLGESMGIPYDVICACAHVQGHPLTTPYPHPPTPRGDPWNQSKFNST